MGLTFVLLFIELILVVAFLALTVACIPKIMVQTAPSDIRDKVMEREDYPLWRTILGFAGAIAILALVAGIFIYAGKDAIARKMNFVQIFERFAILLCGYKIFDMVCFDYILLTKLNIFQTFFPETIGCKGYESFGFNLKSQLLKLFIFVLVSLGIAAILSKMVF